MNWLRKTVSILVTAHMVLAPMSVRAQSLAPEDQAKFDLLKQKLDLNAYSIVLDKDGKGAFIFEKGEKDPKAFFPFRTKEELRRYSPKSLNAKMIQEMKKVTAASGAAWSHSWRNLPAESGIFAMAMGAVVATQLFSNYSQNPIAMKQHLEHQISPVGIASFYSFMYAQGVTSNVLAMYLTNPAYRHMIPYLGMAVGAFVQSYLSQVLSDPNVMACGKTMLGQAVTPQDLEAGIDADPCAKAYEYLIVNKKIWEFAPGIISMVASSAVAGLIQGTAANGLKLIPRISGFDIATMLVPGGMQVKGIRLLLVKGLQIYLFVSIDHFLNSTVNFIWRNTWDGAEFLKLNNNLVDGTFAQKRSQWSGDNKALLNTVKQFHKKSGEWRMMNLSDIYEAHQNWSDSLQQLTGMFNASYSFYNAFVNEARNSQKKANGLLNISYPLNGVIAKDLADGKQDLYFTNPDFIQSMQVDTVNDVVAYIDKSFQDATYRNQNWMPIEEKRLREIRDLLSSEDTMVKAQGLIALNKEIDRSTTIAATSEYLGELQRIYTMLGNPQPMLEPGRGFLTTYAAAPANAPTLSGAPPKYINGMYQTAQLTDFLLMQMSCGPDAENNETSILHSAGFPSIFAPPQLKNPADDFSQSCFMSGELETPMIYRSQVQAADGKKYNGFLDYIKVNIRPSVLGQDTSNFPDWWKKTTESQMQAAFSVYEKSYSEIVAKLITRIFHSENKKDSEKSGLEKTTSYLKSFFTVEDSAFNIGPMSNTATTSLYQEARTYQLILGEMLKDVYRAQKNSALPSEYLAPQMEPAVQFTADEVNAKFPSVPLLAMLGRSSTLEFDRLVQPFVNYPAVGSASKPMGYRLKVQDDIEKEMDALFNLLKQIKVVTVTDPDAESGGGVLSWFKPAKTFTAIQSPIENDQLEDQLLKIQSALTRFKNIIGANQADSLEQTLLSVDGQATPVPTSEKLNRAKQNIQLLMALINAGATGKTQSYESWNEAIATAQTALDAMKEVAPQDPSEAPAFSIDAQITKAKETIAGLGELINTTERSSSFNGDWQRQLSAVQLSLQALVTGLDGGIKATTALVQLTDAQQALARTCIENLQSLAMEMKMYGSIANAVDWEKLRNLKRLNSQQQSFENETQKKLRQLRAAGTGMIGRH